MLNWMWVQLQTVSAAGRQPVMVDIGMNAGFFSAFAASIGTRVYAFEPQPACIKSAALANPAASVTMFNYAVSARNATLTVSTEGCNPGNTIFSGAAGCKVHTIPLGSAWELACVPFIDVVKIDVEGAELSVIEGLLPLIESKRIGTLIMEMALPSTRESWPVFGYNLESGVYFLEKAFRGRYTIEFLYSPDNPPVGHHSIESVDEKTMGLPQNVRCTGASNSIHKVVDLAEHLKFGGGNYLFRVLP